MIVGLKVDLVMKFLPIPNPVSYCKWKQEHEKASINAFDLTFALK